MPFVVSQDHRCFPEVLQFFVHAVALRLWRQPRLFDEHDYLTITGPTPKAVRLLRAAEILNGEPETLEFDIVVSSPEEAGREPDFPRIFPTLCVYLMGYAWERHGSVVMAAAKPPGMKLDDVDPELQFFYHLRNACFHGGTFDIKAYHPIAPPKLPEWRGIEITSHAQINGTRVINAGFLTVPHVPWLLHDMGKAIDRVLGT